MNSLGISNVKSRESLVMSTEDDPFGAAPFNAPGESILVNGVLYCNLYSRLKVKDFLGAKFSLWLLTFEYIQVLFSANLTPL